MACEPTRLNIFRNSNLLMKEKSKQENETYRRSKIKKQTQMKLLIIRLTTQEKITGCPPKNYNYQLILPGAKYKPTLWIMKYFILIPYWYKVESKYAHRIEASNIFFQINKRFKYGVWYYIGVRFVVWQKRRHFCTVILKYPWTILSPKNLFSNPSWNNF